MKKILTPSLIINFFSLAIFVLAIDFSGGWGNIGLYLSMLFILPSIVFVLNFFYDGLSAKIKLSYSCMVIYFISFIATLNPLYIMAGAILPLLIALCSHYLSIILIKIGVLKK